MKAKSEFQVILENKLTGQKSDVTFESESVTEAAGASAFDEMLSSLFFTHGPVKQNISTVSFYYQKKENVQQPTEEIKAIPLPVMEIPKAQPAPKVKVKRVLTFDQVKAMSIFTKFGEKEINDYASDEDIKAAYRRLAKKFHPDAGAKNDLNFKIISSAYRKLIF